MSARLTLLTAALVAIALATGLLVHGILQYGLDRNEQQAADIQSAALWESSGGKIGQVNAPVIDACAQRTREPRCVPALRGALRFYGELGGAHGCAQVKRALAIYPNLGDDASVAAAAKCLEKK